MEQKIKIFSTVHAPEDLEKAVNHWLGNNRDVNILNMTTTNSASLNPPALMLIVLYERMRKIQERDTDAKRGHERIDLFDIVDYTVEGNYYRDFVRDISESGLFITTKHRFEAGQDIHLTFMVSKLERPLKMKGKIARILPDGIGVRFIKESQVQEDMIRTLIASVTMPDKTSEAVQ